MENATSLSRADADLHNCPWWCVAEHEPPTDDVEPPEHATETIELPGGVRLELSQLGDGPPEIFLASHEEDQGELLSLDVAKRLHRVLGRLLELADGAQR